MSTALDNAWSRTKSRSLLLRVWRWSARQANRQALAAETIGSANLPASIAARIDDITRRTKLWATERADIARELAAHATDALGSQRDANDILTSMGDPKTVARLMRRSAKRKRSWLWQLRWWTSNAILVTLGTMTLAYAALFVRFNTGAPEVTRHFMAELNERNAGYAQDQHAWPAVEALWIEWKREDLRLSVIDNAEREAFILSGDDPFEQTETRRERALGKWWNATPEHSGYTEFRAFMDRIGPQIEAAARAAHLPTFGGLYSDRSEQVNIENASFSVTRTVPPSTRADETESLITVLLPWLSHTRKASQILLTDAYFAAESGDAQRAADRIESCALFGGLASDDGFVISYLVGMSIQQQSEKMLLRILHEQPDLFTDAQLVRLSHRLSSTARRTQQIDMRIERTMLLDVLQRCFTDDGHGDGRLTAAGFELFADEVFPIAGPSSQDFTLNGTAQPTTVARLLGPTALVTVASRREHIEAYDHLIGFMEAALKRDISPLRSAELMAELDAEFTEIVAEPLRFPILGVLMPAMGNSVRSVQTARAHTGAALLTVAAHIHHRRTGAWPNGASDLVPHLLPRAPEDPFNPGQPFRLLVREGRLLVYSLGSDADDDRGTIEPNESGFLDTSGVRDLSDRYPRGGATPGRITDGDWIIYPPLD